MVAIVITVVIITIISLSCAQNVCDCQALSPYVCKASQQRKNSPKKIQTEEERFWKAATVRRGVFVGGWPPRPSQTRLGVLCGVRSIIRARLIKPHLLSTALNQREIRSQHQACILKKQLISIEHGTN